MTIRHGAVADAGCGDVADHGSYRTEVYPIRGVRDEGSKAPLFRWSEHRAEHAFDKSKGWADQRERRLLRSVEIARATLA
jgi:hypothetical protein